MSLITSGRTWDEASSPAAVRLARRFEDAWRNAANSGRYPAPGEFLADLAHCPGARLALLRAEMTLRWEDGERVNASWFRDREPDLGDETLVALIYEEFCLREEDEAAEPPAPADYYARYPDVAESLRRVLDIHGLVDSGTTTALHLTGPPAIPFPAAGETIAGFRLVEELGRGAFARVFLAQERQLADRLVALKVSRTGSREPQTLARLQHTHIVPVHSYRTDPATSLHLLCMPYFGRVTLARVLDDSKVRTSRSGAELIAAIDRLGATESPQGQGQGQGQGGRAAGRMALARRSYAQAIAWWGARMAEALEHAHDRGVLHRDVKPTNVLVTADAMPMLLDFNLARATVLDDAEAERAVPGGTLDYMSPEHLDELAEGRSDQVDARSDLYGLGVLLYEALAGSRPFPAPRGVASAGEMLQHKAEDRRAGPPKLRDRHPEVPAAMAAIVTRCLAPDPDDRYASASDLATDLQAVADDRPLKYASEPLPARVYRWGRRHRRLLATSLPVVLALLGIAAEIVQERNDHNRNYARVKWSYDQGVAYEASGDLPLAILQFDSAYRLADRPGRDSTESESQTKGAGSNPSDLWPSLDALRQQARNRYKSAKRTEATRGAADALSAAADALRFRLLGFGDDLEAASHELALAFRPLQIFERDDWVSQPDLGLLDPPRRDRLIREVNELLFLWALALDRQGADQDDSSLRAKAVEVCDRALGFARPAGPWNALRAWSAAPGSDRGDHPVKPPSLTGESSALACFQWGTLMLREDRKAEAAPWFSQAVRFDEGNYVFHYYLAYAHDHPTGNPREALRHYDAALALKPRSPWIRFTRARYYRRGRDWTLAKEDLQRALSDFHALRAADRNPGFESQTRLELGLIQQSLGDLSAARRQYAAVIAADPDGRYAFAARLNRAKLDADAGQVEHARAEFDTLLAAHPDDDTARLGRAMLALRVGEPASAEADLAILLDAGLDPSVRADALQLRALARLSLGRASEAVDDADEALRLGPGPAAERLRTRARIALGRTGEVKLVGPDEVDELPVNGRPLHDDLRRLVDQTRRNLAARAINGSRRLEATLTLAVALSALGMADEAEDEAERALAMAPLSSRVFLVRARVRAYSGEIEAALADIKQALDLEPDDPRTFELRGRLSARLGKPTATLADLNRAIALGLEGASVRRERAAVLMDLGKAAGSVRDWDQALAHDLDDPRSFLGRARALIALHQWDPALADLEQAVGWVDGRPELGLQIALAYARCLPRRPEHLPRMTALLRRVWADCLSRG